MHQENELLLLASEGDEAAFTSLFNLYKDKLYSFLFRLTASSEVTEDIIQDAFLRLWKDKDLLKTIDNFSAYIFRMTHNHAINALKRLANENSILTELDRRNSGHTSGSECRVEFKEARRLIQETLQKLPPQQQLIFTLSRDHGMKHEEIARRLNISPSTVKNHLVKALRTMREKLPANSNSVTGVYLFIQLFTSWR